MCRSSHASRTESHRFSDWRLLIKIILLVNDFSLCTTAAVKGNDYDSHSSTQKPSHASNGGAKPAASAGARTTAAAASAPKTVAERRNEFAIRPGYSSGASSYDGSVGGDDEDRDLRVSRHSDILALSELRSEMVAEGDLTKTVVRIEVRASR